MDLNLRCCASILLCVVTLMAGCASNQTESVREPAVITRLVNPPRQVPVELAPYRQRFEDILATHGLSVAPDTDPHALVLVLNYDPSGQKVSVALLQGGRPLVQSTTSPGMFYGKGTPSETLDALVDRTEGEFSDELSSFLRHATYTDGKAAAAGVPVTPAPSTSHTEFGTAFATNSPTTYVTARHVVNDGGDITLYCGPDRSAKAHVAEVDAANDLVVLKSDLKAPTFLELAPSDSMAPGDHVFTMGFPTPDLLGVEPKYTDGAISALSGFGDTKSLIQITVPIQPGNSGGPLVDTQGRLVGVIDSTAAVANFYKLSGGALPQNVNFAVNAYYLYPLVKDIPHTSDAAFAKLTPVKRVTQSLCLVVVKSD